MNINIPFKQGGGAFIAKKSYPIEVISSGLTGNFKTLTPPAGQRIKLTWVSAPNNMTSLTTITIGGNVVVNAVLVAGSSAGLATSNVWGILDGINEIITEVDEDVVFSTNVALSSTMEIMYQEGVTE